MRLLALKTLHIVWGCSAVVERLHSMHEALGLSAALQINKYTIDK
jgi:hypothetical protein